MDEADGSPLSVPCPFCHRIEAGEVLVDAGSAFALADAFPVSAGHTLVVSRRHVADFFDLGDDEQDALLALVREVRRTLARDPGFDGLNVGLNVGETAGQTIPHAHVHVIPRRTGDVPDPRGGVRWVLPGRAAHWTSVDPGNAAMADVQSPTARAAGTPRRARS